jgi:HlyD family secretion protein
MTFGLIVVAAAGLSVVAYIKRRDPPIEVSVVRVERGEVREMISGAASGEVKPARRVTVRAELAGTVAKVLKKKGERVESGELIVAFSSDELDARLLQADANVEAAEVAVKVAEQRAKVSERALDRAKKLRATEAISEVELDRAQTERDVAGHGVETAAAAKKQAVAAKRLAEVSKKRTLVHAPFDGVLQDVFAELGVQVAPAQAMFDLIDDRGIRVEVPIDESDLSRVAVGQKVQLRTDAARGRLILGTVTFIPPAVGRSSDGSPLDAVPLAATKERSIRIDVTPEDTKDLIVGASVNAELLVSSKPDVLYVPSQVVIGRGVERAVFQIEQGVVKKRTFTPGLTSWERTEVVSGLEAGDEIVSSLNAKGLEEGARAVVKP